MRVMWCWRCKQDVPMLNEDEYHAIYKLYGECFPRNGEKRDVPVGETRPSIDKLFEPVRKEYERMAGMVGCHHNAIMHHRISTYGPPCVTCGKPLRTPRASFCAACGEPVRANEG